MKKLRVLVVNTSTLSRLSCLNQLNVDGAVRVVAIAGLTPLLIDVRGIVHNLRHHSQNLPALNLSQLAMGGQHGITRLGIGEALPEVGQHEIAHILLVSLIHLGIGHIHTMKLLLDIVTELKQDVGGVVVVLAVGVLDALVLHHNGDNLILLIEELHRIPQSDSRGIVVLRSGDSRVNHIPTTRGGSVSRNRLESQRIVEGNNRTIRISGAIKPAQEIETLGIVRVSHRNSQLNLHIYSPFLNKVIYNMIPFKNLKSQKFYD